MTVSDAARAGRGLRWGWIVIAVLALASLGACGVDRRSEAYRCDAQGNCSDGRVCEQGWCVVPAGGVPDAGTSPSCPAACDSCEDGTCFIACVDAQDCLEKVVCPPGLNCDVTCTGNQRCPDGVDCSQAADCTVLCEGNGACGGGVSCGTGVCDVTCDGMGACGMGIDCSASCACDTDCESEIGCGEPTCPGEGACERDGDCSSTGCDAC